MSTFHIIRKPLNEEPLSPSCDREMAVVGGEADRFSVAQAYHRGLWNLPRLFTYDPIHLCYRLVLKIEAEEKDPGKYRVFLESVGRVERGFIHLPFSQILHTKGDIFYFDSPLKTRKVTLSHIRNFSKTTPREAVEEQARAYIDQWNARYQGQLDSVPTLTGFSLKKGLNGYIVQFNQADGGYFIGYPIRIYFEGPEQYEVAIVFDSGQIIHVFDWYRGAISVYQVGEDDIWEMVEEEKLIRRKMS